jgi:hypothetical protein
MNRKRIKAVPAVLMVVTTLASAAAPDTAQTVEAVEAPINAGPIEEIVITEQRSSIGLISEIEQTEVKMFSLFNDLNSDDDYDVNCGNKTYTGTLIPVWECDVGFLKREREQDMQDWRAGFRMPRSEAQLRSDNVYRIRDLNAEIKRVALENPEFASLLFELEDKRQALQEANRNRKRRFFGKE